MAFCISCGGELASGGRFCTSCGHPVPAATTFTTGSAPSQVGSSPAPGEPIQDLSRDVPRAPAFSPPEAQLPNHPRQPHTISSSGGAAVAVSPISTAPLDMLRLGLGVVALLLSLALPWDLQSRTAGSPWSLISVLVALIGTAVPFVMTPRPGAAAQQVQQYQLLRLLPLAPLSIFAIVTVVRDLADGRGCGVGVAFALGGAVLGAAQRGTATGPTNASLWRQVSGWSFVISAVWMLILAVWVMKEAYDRWSPSLTFVLAMCVPFLAMGAITLFIGLGMLRHRAVEWISGLIFGVMLVIGVLAAGLSASADGGRAGAIVALYFVGLAGAAAPGVVDLMLPRASTGVRWVQVVSSLLVIASVFLTALAMEAALALAVEFQPATGKLVWLLIYAISAALGAVVVRQHVAASPRKGRRSAAIWAAATGVIGTVNLFALVGRVSAIDIASTLLLPVAVLVILNLPAVNRELGPLVVSAAAVDQTEGHQPWTQQSQPPGSPFTSPVMGSDQTSANPVGHSTPGQAQIGRTTNPPGGGSPAQ